jgi:hypothetical protein
MDTTRSEKRVLVGALVLAVVGLVLVVGDRLGNTDVADRALLDGLQLAFAIAALVCGIAVVVRHRRRSEIAARDDQIIDLRERLNGYVDLDDEAVEAELRVGR